MHNFLINSEFLVKCDVGSRLKTPFALRISAFKVFIKLSQIIKNTIINNAIKIVNIILFKDT